MDYPKVLVVGVNPWIDNTGINTLINFFESWDRDKLAHIYTRDKVPNTSICNTFFRISEPKVLKSILENDVDAFNDALEKSLKDHRAFWSQKRILRAGGDPVCMDSNGFISLPLTAICAIAYDKNFPIDHDCAYIPEFLITGEDL